MGSVATSEAADQALLARGGDEFLQFYSEFEQRLDDLKDALRSTRRTKDLAAALQEKGAMKNFVGSFSGRNDRELASMMEDMGAGLETTQVILQLVMKVQNTKNRFLRQFHQALVDKVSLIENDTATLDTNQRKAAVAIVSELRDQIAGQLEQQAMVEEHQQKLHELDGYLQHKDSVDRSQDEKIRRLESRAMEIIRTDQEQQRLIEGLKSAHASKDELDRIQTQRIDSLMTAASELELEADKRQRAIDLLEQQQSLLIGRVRELESAARAQGTPKAIILRNLLPGVALMVGAAALVLHYLA